MGEVRSNADDERGLAVPDTDHRVNARSAVFEVVHQRLELARGNVGNGPRRETDAGDFPGEWPVSSVAGGKLAASERKLPLELLALAHDLHAHQFCQALVHGVDRDRRGP